MAALTAPSDIARETLRTLAGRKLAPTPDNYARVYQEISGVPSTKSEAAAMPAQETPPGGAKPAPLWSKLIRDLLKQLETPHKGITITRKKEGLETVLSKFASNPDMLFEKLLALMNSWATAPTAAAPADLAPIVPDAAAAPAALGTSQSVIKNIEIAGQLRELLAQALEGFIGTQPDLVEEIRALAGQARIAGDEGQVAKLAKQMRQLLIKLELRNEDREKIQEGVVRLLRLLVNNISELAGDEKWLHGQTLVLKEIIAQPMDKRSIADAERNLRNAIIEQGYLKESLNDAKATLRNLMATFIDRLGSVTESTGAYHDKVAEYSEKIAGADNLAALSQILDEIMLETRAIRDEAQRSHDELIVARKQAQEAEERVRELEQKLEQTSELVHSDQLTGALNRRGMEETLEREIKRSERQQTPVSLALLDIDNFKQLNDTLGHQAGDRALVHMAKVIKDALRPTDAVARYGGEEFIIILPDTDLPEGVETVTRLQRELTKMFFMHENKRLLITFSAGVALRNNNEEAEVVIARADQAMYRAKKSGKNRVFPAE